MFENNHCSSRSGSANGERRDNDAFPLVKRNFVDIDVTAQELEKLFSCGLEIRRAIRWMASAGGCRQIVEMESGRHPRPVAVDCGDCGWHRISTGAITYSGDLRAAALDGSLPPGIEIRPARCRAWVQRYGATGELGLNDDLFGL